MSAPFAPSPKLREYINWFVGLPGCKVKEGFQGNKSLICFESPNGTVHQVGLSDTEPLCHAMIAYLDRRLGVDAPFPKTPTPY